MTMRKRAGSVLFTAAAAVAIVGISVGPALAATSLTVKVSGGGSYTAKAGKTVLSDNGVNLTCKSSKATGKIASGKYHGAAPLKVGTTKTLTFSSCTSAAGTPTFTYHGFPYSVTANGKTVSGETAAIISGTNVGVTITAVGCSFTVTGSATGYYSNAKHTLYITPRVPKKLKPINKKAQLTIGNVSGTCLGAVTDGQHPTFTGTYSVSRKIKITSS
jgi:hypothetical protein